MRAVIGLHPQDETWLSGRHMTGVCEALPKQRANMMIVELVIDHFSVPAGLHNWLARDPEPKATIQGYRFRSG